MALHSEVALGNTVVKLRWEEPQASAGLDRKDLAVNPRGVYRGFVAQPGVGLLLDIVPDPTTGESLAVFETTGTLPGQGSYTPTAGWNVAVYTTLPISIDATPIVGLGNKAVVLRAQFNEGGLPATNAFVQIVDPLDVKPQDVVICLINVPAGPPPDLTTSTITNGLTARSIHPLFVTVGDGFASFGDFTGNRVALGGLDTSDAIQKAADALRARVTLLEVGAFSGAIAGVVFVKRGRYAPTAVINVPSAVRIVGEGRGSTAVGMAVEVRQPGIPAVPVQPCFQMGTGAGGVADASVENLTIVGLTAGPPTTQEMIRIELSTNCIIRDVDFFGNNNPGVRLVGSNNCILENLRGTFGTAPNIVRVDSVSSANRIQGLPLNAFIEAGSLGNVVATGAADGPGRAATNFGNETNRVFGALQPFLKGYSRGLDILTNSLAVSGSGFDGDNVVITPGVVEIDGYFYSLAAPTTIAAVALPVATGINYIYAKRDTAVLTANALTFEASATEPAYDAARDYWVHAADVGVFPTRRYIGSVLAAVFSAATRVRFQSKQGDRVLYSMDNSVTSPTTGGFLSFSITVPGGLTGSTVNSSVPLTALPLLRPHRSLAGGGTQLGQMMLALLDIDVIATVVDSPVVRTFALVASDGPSAGANRIRTSMAVTLDKTSGTTNPRFRFPMVLVPASTQSPLTVPTTEFSIVEFAPTVGTDRTYNFRVYQRGYVDVR